LEAGIAAGVFRSDLFTGSMFFRLKCLSAERRQDIPVLVSISLIVMQGKQERLSDGDKKSLDCSVVIPGRVIRELQNVIERSVIVCETETFQSMRVGSLDDFVTEPKVQFEFL